MGTSTFISAGKWCILLFCIVPTYVYGMPWELLPDGRIKYGKDELDKPIVTEAFELLGIDIALSSSPYFTVRDFCTDTTIPDEIIISPYLVDNLDFVRAFVGEDFEIVSGYEPSRSGESAHKYGLAVDIASSSYDSYELSQMLYALNSTGIGTYFNFDGTPTHTAHGDVRGYHNIPDCPYSYGGVNSESVSWSWWDETPGMESRDWVNQEYQTFDWLPNDQPYQDGIGPMLPEPATIALLGFGGLALLHRRRRG